MIMTLHHDKRVARVVLHGYVPRLFGTAASSTDQKSFALTQCVKGEPTVCAQTLAFRGFYRAGLIAHQAREKITKWSFTNETEAGAVRLVEDGEAGLACAVAHVFLAVGANGHERVLEIRALDSVQEVSLILCAITRFVQLRS